ncbi:hypothetical protein PCC7418_2005 [Halothece sp. PCC 7418]|uniref:hypothetical protein n=1 Tax=Halothece sp. (strain PCC 7418) TaxID=65093 RepID=UPI0002A05C1D|nr:hypothetical protein [Halothece sp. PCC 7418]AFZ44171.1 hypothetical protein PCC7418_2005 [Halothece sp. PCC 7418]
MTTASKTRNLGIVSLATLMVSAHYGLGFVLGTAEQSFTEGVTGSLYASAIALGTIALALLAPFYWSHIDPIWTILGERYGQPLKVGIGVMSWTSLIGIEAVQIISVAAILTIVGFPTLPTMIAVTGLFFVISLLPVERASWLFRGFLLFNLLVLGSALWQLHNGAIYGQMVLDFWPRVSETASPKTIGVMLSTVLLVLIDMKCQQFVVRARSLRVACWGCILGGLVLAALAFLPGAIVLAAQEANIIPAEVTGKSVIPYILGWLGGGTAQPLGMIFIASLAFPAFGLGSNILRIQTKASLDITNLENRKRNEIAFAGLNALCALGIALRGGEIVGLIVCFYATYLSVVWIPFIAYLLERSRIMVFSQTSVRFALGIGGVAAIVTLGISLFAPDAIWLYTPELTISSMGLGFSSLGLVSSRVVESLPALFAPKKSMG